jgi:hypothetical protein
MYSIWCFKDKSAYMVVNDLTPEDLEAFDTLEFEKVMDLKARTKEGAAREFEAWAKNKQPDARVEHVDQRALQHEIMRKLT